MTKLIERMTRRNQQQSQSGIVIIWGALLIVIFMTMAAFVIDLGAWYARRLQVQRAVDAASSAGAQRIEELRRNPAAVTSAVTSTLEANGFSAAQFTVETCPNASGQWSGSLCGDSGVESGQEVAVRITDNNAPQFFSQLVLSDAPVVRRSAKARLETLPKTASPYNSFGDGRPLSLSGGDRPSLLWAQIAGRCTAAEDGDLFSAEFDENNRSRDADLDGILGETGEQTGFGSGTSRSFYRCANNVGSGVKANPAYTGASDNPNPGYVYRIEVPASASQHYIYGLDATYWTGYLPRAGRTITVGGYTDSAPTTRAQVNECSTSTIHYSFCLTEQTVTRNEGVLNFTPDATDAASPDTELCPFYESSCAHGLFNTEFYLRSETGAFSRCAQIAPRDPTFTLDKGWVRFSSCNIPASTAPQVYYLRVLTTDRSGFSSQAMGVNGFGLKVTSSTQTSTYTCTTETVATCPTVQPDSYFSALAKLTRNPSAPTVAEIPLAKVQSSYNGSTLRFTVFDPGEGADSIQILDSSRNPVSMRITKKRIMNDGTIVDNGTLFAATTTFDVSNSGCTAGLCPIPDTTWWEAGRDTNELWSRDKYNDRMVQIEVPIDGVVDVAGADKFYYIRYTVAAGTGNDPNDSTTWRVEVVDNRVSIIQ
jgi:Flp pilus assembly protein TadG